MDVQGHCDDRFADGRPTQFERNFAERGELGASVGVTVGGETVVDLWGGHADAERTRPWDKDTLCVVMSSTKGATALAAHLLASDGRARPRRARRHVLAGVRGQRQGGRARPPPAQPPGRPARAARPAPAPAGSTTGTLVDAPARRRGAVLGAGHAARLPRPHVRLPRRRGRAPRHRTPHRRRSSPTRSPARSASTSASACPTREHGRVATLVPPPPPRARRADPAASTLQAMTDPTSIPALVLRQHRRLPGAGRVGLARGAARPSCPPPAASTNARALAGHVPRDRARPARSAATSSTPSDIARMGAVQSAGGAGRRPAAARVAGRSGSSRPAARPAGCRPAGRDRRSARTRSATPATAGRSASPTPAATSSFAYVMNQMSGRHGPVAAPARRWSTPPTASLGYQRADDLWVRDGGGPSRDSRSTDRRGHDGDRATSARARWAARRGRRDRRAVRRLDRAARPAAAGGEP